MSLPSLISANRFSTTRVVSDAMSSLLTYSGKMFSIDPTMCFSVERVTSKSRIVCCEQTPSGLLRDRPSRTGGLQVKIPRVNYKVGKESAQYRGPVIWNFIARLANFNVNIQKDSFKNILRRLSQNINSFLFEAPMIAMKDRDFVYF